MIQKMEKLSGEAFSTQLGTIRLKQFIGYGIANTQLAYFYTNIEHCRCLLCAENDALAYKLYKNMMRMYESGIENIGSYACKGSTMMLGEGYSFVLLNCIRKEEELERMGKWLTNHQILQLAECLFEIVRHLKEKNLYFGDFNPRNIIHNINGNFNVIGGFSASTCLPQQQYFHKFPHVEEQRRVQYKYLSPETLATNGKAMLDYKSDLFVVGCILYEVVCGKYPFQEASDVVKYQYIPTESNLSGFQSMFQMIFQPYEKRIDPEHLLMLIQQEKSSSCFKTTRLLENPSSSKSISNEGFSIFNNIQKFFNKMSQQMVGLYLNFTQNTDSEPNLQYLQPLLEKIHKNEGKFEKMKTVMERYIKKSTAFSNFDDGDAYFILKNIHLILILVREGPEHDFSLWLETIQNLSSRAVSIPFILTFCKVVKAKIEFHDSECRMLSGNMYLDHISKYLEISIENVISLARYTERMMTYLGRLTAFQNLKGTQKAALLTVCDQIHNSISVLIFLILAIKKDNMLNLRDDDLKQLGIAEKTTEILLKKVDSLCQQSNDVSGHPLYELETGYFWYQEELYLDFEPILSSFQYFYKEPCYKGLKLPNDVLIKYDITREGPTSVSMSLPNKLKKFPSSSISSKEENRKSKNITEQKVFSNFESSNKQLSTRSEKKPQQFDQFPFPDFKPPQSSKPYNTDPTSEFDIEKCNIYSYQWLKSTEKIVQKLFKEPEIDALRLFVCQQICKELKLKQLIKTINSKKSYILNPNNVLFERVIGSGSAGEVYIGRYEGNVVAIKKVKTASNPGALKEFQREVLTYFKMGQHPNLVSMVGLTKYQQDFFLLTQFCEGGSLFDLLHRKINEIELGWKERMKLALEIAEGMNCLHNMKPPILHRDLKSLNVFITKDKEQWTAKVADFGLSRCPEAGLMTSALGTLHWMAPELLENKQYSTKIDVYSFGIVLWEICCRRTPYHTLKTPMAIVRHVAVEKQRPLLDLIPSACPKQLISLMQVCWAHESQNRPSFPQIITALKKISSSYEPKPSRKLIQTYF